MLPAGAEPGRLARRIARERPLARLPRWAAVLALLLSVAALGWSALAVPGLASADAPRARADATSSAIGDFELYARINAAVAAGADYHEAAMALHRAHDYPTQPFVTVRLPTLAHLNALLGARVVGWIALALLLANALAAMRLLRGQGCGLRLRWAGGFAVLLAGAGVMAAQAALVHELIAGLLLSLAMLWYRPGRWRASWLLAAAALAVRELALPFVLLWLAFAVIERRWREAAAVALLLALFAGGLYLHAQELAALALPGDRASPGWGALAGPALPLLALAKLTGLLFAPLWLAGPLALLPLLGWIGLGGRRGWFATLWFAGFFAAMAIFARTENFYWVMLVLPAYAIGLVLAPRAIGDLIRAATQRIPRES